jgi:hypothetical protein
MAKTGKVWRCDPVKRKRGEKLNFFKEESVE